jgi:hypothetical protein
MTGYADLTGDVESDANLTVRIEEGNTDVQSQPSSLKS